MGAFSLEMHRYSSRKCLLHFRIFCLLKLYDGNAYTTILFFSTDVEAKNVMINTFLTLSLTHSHTHSASLLIRAH